MESPSHAGASIFSSGGRLFKTVEGPVVPPLTNREAPYVAKCATANAKQNTRAAAVVADRASDSSSFVASMSKTIVLGSR